MGYICDKLIGRWLAIVKNVQSVHYGGVMKNEFQEVLKELNRLDTLSFSRTIVDVTENHMTPVMESCVEGLCEIDGLGRKTALEILFRIGVNL